MMVLDRVGRKITNQWLNTPNKMGGRSLADSDREDGLESQEDKLWKAHETVGDGLDVIAGIKADITVPSSTERWTSSGGRPICEEAGKGMESRRTSVSAKNRRVTEKNLENMFIPLRNCLSPCFLVPGATPHPAYPFILWAFVYGSMPRPPLSLAWGKGWKQSWEGPSLV